MSAPLGIGTLRGAPAVATDGDSGDGNGMLPKLILQFIILLALNDVPAGRPALLSAAARAGSRAVAASLHAGKAARQLCGWELAKFSKTEARRKPAAAADSAGPAIWIGPTAAINLATALYLSNARPLVIASAEASVEEAAAQFQNARVLWLPDLNAGTGYFRHDGTDQSTDGTIILDVPWSKPRSHKTEPAPAGHWCRLV